MYAFHTRALNIKASPPGGDWWKIPSGNIKKFPFRKYKEALKLGLKMWSSVLEYLRDNLANLFILQRRKYNPEMYRTVCGNVKKSAFSWADLAPLPEYKLRSSPCSREGRQAFISRAQVRTRCLESTAAVYLVQPETQMGLTLLEPNVGFVPFIYKWMKWDSYLRISPHHPRSVTQRTKQLIKALLCLKVCL